MSRLSHMNDMASLYFALVSGYLVAAFLVGSRLTRLQVVVVNTLFVLWSIGLLLGWTTAMTSVIDLEAAIIHLESKSETFDFSLAAFSAYSFTIVQSAGIIAALVFMWSVRHPMTK